MVSETKKISVPDNQSRENSVEIKKDERKKKWHQEKRAIDGEVEKLYDSKRMNYLEKPTKRFSIWLFLVFPSLFGLIAGLIGGFFILTTETIKIPFFEEISLRQYFPTREITLTTEKKVTVTQDLRIIELIKNLKPLIGRIFVAKEDTSAQQNLSFLEQIYSPHQMKSLGLILTSDGWLISTNNFDSQGKYVVVDANNQIFSTEKIIKDELTNLTFLKVEAKNWPVIKLADSENVSQGQQILIFDKFEKLYLSEISQINARDIVKTEDLVRSTDYFSEFVLINKDVANNFFEGSPVFTLDGALIGLVSQGKVLPVWQFRNIINQVLDQEKIRRNYLGIDYLRIEEAAGLLSARFKDLGNGVIIYGNPINNSPSDLAGIQNADVIMKVDGLPLRANQNLTSLIQDKKPGDEVEFTLLRDGQERMVKVILASRP